MMQAGLRYNKQDFLNDWFIAILGGRDGGPPLHGEPKRNRICETHH